MPYYIYKIISDNESSAKKLELASEHENFKIAKQEVRNMRASQLTDENTIYKMIFAESQPEAEKQLLTPREQPIIKEWEK